MRIMYGSSGEGGGESLFDTIKEKPSRVPVTKQRLLHPLWYTAQTTLDQWLILPTSYSQFFELKKKKGGGEDIFFFFIYLHFFWRNIPLVMTS